MGFGFHNPIACTQANPPSVNNVTGTLYSFVPNASFNLKALSALAIVGAKPLLDVSGPSSAIDGTSTDNYKYCYALKANECVLGSTAGRVYVNAPYVTTSSLCYGGAVLAPYSAYTESELCFTNYGGFYERLDQIGLTPSDRTGANTRAITQAFTPTAFKGGYANSQPTPDGKWLLFPMTQANGRTDVVEVQTPSWPTQSSPNRQDFIQVPVTLSPPGSLGANNAILEFGYDSSFYCTSRQEPCVAVSAACNQSAPFYFEASDSYSGAACSAGCTITVPVIPGHVVYYRWKYRDNSNQVLATGPIQVAAAY
jgi:hypothetical protein